MLPDNGTALPYKTVQKGEYIMKICNSCNAQNDDASTVCEYCGSSDFKPSDTAPLEQPYQPSVTTYAYQQPTVVKAPDLGNGNVIAGIVGALLFSIIGGLLYFGLYQMGIIAGICGLVIFVLANFGYNLFAKGNKNTIVGLVVCIIVLILMIVISEYLCISFEIYQAFKEEESITFFDAVRVTPDFLEIPEVKSAFIKDLAFGLIFGFIASISNITAIVKARKNNQ